MDQDPPQNNNITRLLEANLAVTQTRQPWPVIRIPFLLNSLLNRGDLENIVNGSLEENKELPKPMCKNFIEGLKQIKIKTSDDLSCAICQDKFKGDEIVIELPCKDGKHFFHFEEGECPGLKPWIEINNTCPICRTEFPLEPEPEPEPEPEAEPELESSEAEPELESDAEPGGGIERRIVLAENIMDETFTNIMRDYIDRAFEELEDRELNEAIQRSLDDS